MTNKVGIIGIGRTNARSVSPDVSFRELIFEAATKAYNDAGVKNTDIGSFVCCEEDFMVGYSISDEYTPEQMGAVHKPVQTVPGDFLHGLAVAKMMINAELFDVVVVESHSKASNVKTLDDVHGFAMDPAYNRPLKANTNFIAGLEMNRYMFETGTTEEDCANVVAKAKYQALKNPGAAWGANVTTGDVLGSTPLSSPLKTLDAAKPADGAVLVVVASEDWIKKNNTNNPVWLNGIGWASDSPWLEGRSWSEASYAKLASDQAYKMAGVTNPAKDFDVYEIDDTYSYKTFQHLEALGICKAGEGKKVWSEMPINVSGGSLGYGNLFETNGGVKLYEACLQLRGQAGLIQVANAKNALVQSWRGVPTTSGAVAVLGK